MLTVKSLISDVGTAALARDLSEITGTECKAQKVHSWWIKDAVPSHWLGPVLTWLRRRGIEPTADDLVALCPPRVVLHQKTKARLQAEQATKKGKILAKVPAMQSGTP